MTSQLPWITLVMRRKQLGLTQRELADGIVTQSLVSQIERGRVLPSERIIRCIAERLQLDVEKVVTEWSAWRRRGEVRDGLWLAALISDSSGIRALLQNSTHLLVPFERCVYQALCAALQDEILIADELLNKAWSKDTMQASGMAYGRKAVLHHRTTLSGQSAFAGAWTKTDRARAMVVEAKVQEFICKRLGKGAAARHWNEKVNERMRGALGVRYNE